MDRRKFLAIAGGGVILAAAGASAVVAGRRPDKAILPWSQTESLYSEPRRRALSYALLAPNPHNRQPWLVDLSEQNKVLLFVDTDKLLPHTDPYNRQITIGMGCFLELLVLAAADSGHRVDLELFPDGSNDASLDSRPVAVATFYPDTSLEPDPLFDHVLDRRSLKEPFDTNKPVSIDTIARVNAAASRGSIVEGSNDSKTLQTLRKLTLDALNIEFDTPRTLKESVDLFRIGKKEIEANPDGIDLSGPFFELTYMVGAMSREAALDPTSLAFQGGKDMTFQQTQTAMAYVWLQTPSNRREDQIMAGRDWIRLNLAATAEGVGIHPLSQALQEYPEMKVQYDEIHNLLASGGGTIQMLGRLGYADKVPPSPRWPLEAKVLKD